MKRKFFFKRMWYFVLVMLIPTLLLVAVITQMTYRNQTRQMVQTNRHSIEIARSNISLVLDSIMTQNNYITGMTRTSMVLNKALQRQDLSYTDSIYLRSLVSSLNSMVNSYDYVEMVYIYLDGYDRALSSSNLVNLSTDDLNGWYGVYQAMPEDERTCIALTQINVGMPSERNQIVVCSRMLSSKGCVAVILNVEHLEEMLNLVISDNQALYMMDHDGHLLASAGDPDAEANIQALYGQYFAGQEVSDTLEQNFQFSDQHVMLSWKQYDSPSFYIISAADYSMILKNLGNRLTPMFVMMLVALCVIIFLAYSNTRRSFDQINLMLRMFEDAEAGRTVARPAHKLKDEYDVIMNNILTMFLNNSYLNIQLKEKQYRQQNAELAALQLQINPHFLYNTLQTLDIESRKLQDDGRISAIVRYVSDILKYSLTDPQKSVSLQEELDYLKKYVEVQHYRFGDRFIAYYEVDDEALDAEVFRLMLQPVVENALLHAMQGLSRRGYVKVRVRLLGDFLDLHIIDNGTGMTPEELAALRTRIADRNSRSIGLTNLDRRLRLRYPGLDGLRICSIKNFGTSVSFRIPYKKCRNDSDLSGQ